MNVSCTQKLIDALHTTAQSSTQDVSLFNWHATIVTVNRHKTLLLLNDYSHYAIVLYGIKAPNLKSFSTLVRNAVGDALAASGYSAEAVERYLALSGEVCVSKTNRSLNSSMNAVVRFLDMVLHDPYNREKPIEPSPDSLYRKDSSDRLNRIPMRILGSDYLLPNDVMAEAMEQLMSGNTEKLRVKRPAYIMNIYLPYGETGATRVLAISADTTFKQLHKAIQRIFCWQDYHLYSFDILNDELEVIASVMCDADEDVRQGYAMSAKLRKMLGDGCRLVYTYDYGDDWNHYIEAKYVDDYTNALPDCLIGEGDAPPEDVGGVDGYLEFKRIIGDKSDPEHDEMLEWAQSNGWSRFDLADVNRRLK